MSSDIKAIEKLRRHHSGLDDQLRSALQARHPSPEDLHQIRVLKKRKLRVKDRIAALEHKQI